VALAALRVAKARPADRARAVVPIGLRAVPFGHAVAGRAGMASRTPIALSRRAE
jgi:hypothetical protein